MSIRLLRLTADYLSGVELEGSRVSGTGIFTLDAAWVEGKGDYIYEHSSWSSSLGSPVADMKHFLTLAADHYGDQPERIRMTETTLDALIATLEYRREARRYCYLNELNPPNLELFIVLRHIAARMLSKILFIKIEVLPE